MTIGPECQSQDSVLIVMGRQKEHLITERQGLHDTYAELARTASMLNDLKICHQLPKIKTLLILPVCRLLQYCLINNQFRY